MSFPETGKVFPNGRAGDEKFAKLVSSVLCRALGERSSAIKVVARWTGAGERTVKNWFVAKNAPSGDHFLELVRHCPDMLDEFLAAAGQKERLAGVSVRAARLALVTSILALDKLMDSEDGEASLR
jgi:phenylpyruvate tautomerase PptA (4-oxalocrotonate tautomerase family)